jgi:hypothetical protein
MMTLLTATGAFPSPDELSDLALVHALALREMITATTASIDSQQRSRISIGKRPRGIALHGLPQPFRQAER